MTVLEQYIARRRAIHTLYSENFADTEGIHVKQNPSSEYDSNFWLTASKSMRKNAITKQRMTFAYISNRRISNHVALASDAYAANFLTQRILWKQNCGNHLRTRTMSSFRPLFNRRTDSRSCFIHKKIYPINRIVLFMLRIKDIH